LLQETLESREFQVRFLKEGEECIFECLSPLSILLEELEDSLYILIRYMLGKVQRLESYHLRVRWAHATAFSDFLIDYFKWQVSSIYSANFLSFIVI